MKKIQFRIPLLLFPWIGGLLVGVTGCLIKVMGSFIKAKGIIDSFYTPIPYAFGSLIAFNGVLMFLAVNRGIKYYN